MNTIQCPHCKKQVELSEAIIHEFQEEIRKQEQKNLKTQFEKEKAQEQAEQEKRLRLEFEQKNRKQIEELEVQKKKEKESHLRETKLLEKIAKQEEEQAKLEEKIKEEAGKEAFEKYRLEKLEYQKKINDMQKALEEAQRKGKQGSQQLQGDVLEVDLEERLRQAFPYDDFKPVPTGIKGGDIVHELRNKFGNSAGFILWETKRTKGWDKKWLGKLKDDMRAIGASDCILVTDNLPPKVKIYERVENVWVTSYEYAIKLATVVRFGLLNVAIVRYSASQGDQQLRDLYSIITSDSFRQMFEARDEAITALKLELEADKRAAEKRWKRQGLLMDKLDRNNSQLYGELQAHIPSLKPLQNNHLEIESGNEKDKNTETNF